jgi:hypothetical protein
LILGGLTECALGADGSTSILTLNVRIYDYAAVTEQVKYAAEREAARVFHEVGIELNWIECGNPDTAPDKYAACADFWDPFRFSVKILPKAMARRLPFSPRTCGYAIPADAFVFFHCAHDLSRQIRRPGVGSILGYLAAHELGHLLLGGSGHSDHGIMKAMFHSADFFHAEQGLMRFSPEEGADMRRTLANNARPLAQPPSERNIHGFNW